MPEQGAASPLALPVGPAPVSVVVSDTPFLANDVTSPSLLDEDSDSLQSIYLLLSGSDVVGEYPFILSVQSAVSNPVR
jgi:hypothetical protein